MSLEDTEIQPVTVASLRSMIFPLSQMQPQGASLSGNLTVGINKLRCGWFGQGSRDLGYLGERSQGMEVEMERCIYQPEDAKVLRSCPSNL